MDIDVDAIRYIVSNYGSQKYGYGVYSIKETVAGIAQSPKVRDAYAKFFDEVYNEMIEINSHKVDPFNGKWM